MRTWKEKDKRTPIYMVHPNGLHPREGSLLLSPNVFSNLTREQSTNTPKNIDDVQQCHNSTTTTSRIHDYVETHLTLLYTKRWWGITLTYCMWDNIIL